MSSVLSVLFLFLILVSCKQNTAPTLIEPISGMEFQLIPKGSFEMGDPESTGNDRGASPHQVLISKDFWLGKTEVTQKQWQELMGPEEIHPDKPSPFRGFDPNYPVVSVSYFDVAKFIDTLNALSKIYQFRLPTEAEWEYACRAGTITSFSSGVKLADSLANYNAKVESKYSIPGKFLGHPSPVASYPPNVWGLYDMHGNVWEWVSDWYAPYPNDKVSDPKGPIDGKEKVIRGGSWFFGAENAKSSFRRTHAPGLWGFSIGFRLVCEEK